MTLEAAETRGDRVRARRLKLTSAGLIVVLLALSAVAIGSSQLTQRAVRQASAADTLSDDYTSASAAVAAEESLERKYRLDPNATVLARYAEAADNLVAALQLVNKDGNAADRARVTAVLAQHRVYLRATEQMFRAVDDHDAAAVLKIDGEQVDPTFHAIASSIDAAAAAQHRTAASRLTSLSRAETLIAWLIPTVFFIGLLLVVLLTFITRGFHRRLEVERKNAVHDSLHDALTGLPNRTLLADRVTQALRSGERTGASTGLLLIDLDRFKEINDTFGHNYGDKLLVQVGPRLTAAVRAGDTVSRLGGDEFAVLLPDVRDAEAVTAVARTLLVALEQPFPVEGVVLDVEASIGVVVSGEHGNDVESLVRHADIAMYVAKAQQIGVFTYDREADGHTPEKLAMLGELRRALDRRELVLHYQPKVAVTTGQVVGAEVLVRWEHPERGLVPPDEFIPVAERTGLIGPMTSYVLDEALTQARIWMDAGRPLRVAVNLSARSLLDERLPRRLSRLLAAHHVPAGLLELEITESALMTKPARAQRLLEALSAMGVGVSIDDFGAGYTSLGQLQALPVTELKIDKSFVMTMTDELSNGLIVESVIELGHKLGLTIVAEGVENPEVLAALIGFDCDIVQGFHLCRPLPVAAFDRWYAARRDPVPA